MTNKTVIPDYLKPKFDAARVELGEQEYNDRLTTIFDKPVLNFVSTLVINLPRSCWADCWYCIDESLRHHATSAKKFLDSCQKTFDQFKNIKEVSITGGSLLAKDFNTLMDMIQEHYPDVKITWNTNGVMIDENFNIDKIRYINLHRNGVSDEVNRQIFCTVKPILSIPKAKKLFGDRLYLRMTIDEDFDLQGYARYGIPMYVNRMMPPTTKSESKFKSVFDQLTIADDTDIRRRNKYLNCQYQGVPIRVCVGDELAKRVPNKYPVYLNVAIIHRNGMVCGSWYLDDKVLYDAGYDLSRLNRPTKQRVPVKSTIFMSKS